MPEKLVLDQKDPKRYIKKISPVFNSRFTQYVYTKKFMEQIETLIKPGQCPDLTQLEAKPKYLIKVKNKCPENAQEKYIDNFKYIWNKEEANSQFDISLMKIKYKLINALICTNCNVFVST